MVYDPIGRLKLPPAAGPSELTVHAPEESAPRPVAFPPDAGPPLAAAGSSLPPTGAGGFESTHAHRPTEFDAAAAIEQALAQAGPPPMSALERYRLDGDRELLRQLAYRRHFQNLD
ncbi:MAG: hypothetical protein ACREJ2_18225 [Planctomycetota bacterium]